jgi:hypothetical protein
MPKNVDMQNPLLRCKTQVDGEQLFLLASGRSNREW